MTPEGKVKAQVKQRLKDVGAWQYWPVSNGMGMHGVPDCIACVGGRFLGLEIKAPGRRGRKNRGATALQVVQLKGIQAACGYAAIIDCPEELEEVLEALFAMKPYDFEKEK